MTTTVKTAEGNSSPWKGSALRCSLLLIILIQMAFLQKYLNTRTMEFLVGPFIKGYGVQPDQIRAADFSTH
ncbi:unnamed protein product [Allacma fusca]|uniref:Uncharacterized protein n=1 Tax=Allacma fusca TaxID=39272 RepID=A0A8J2P723_9HEXA|nr:unnamed protein product [Allacma fusca]